MDQTTSNLPALPQNFSEFWPYYMAAHQNARSRALHYVGSTGVIVAVALAIMVSPWWAFAAPIFGYGCAWTGHFAFERNKPATWVRPWWSLMGDWKMFGLWLTGRLAPHLAAGRDLPDIVEMIRAH